MALRVVRAVLAYSVVLLLVAALLLGCGGVTVVIPDGEKPALQLGFLTDTHYAQDCRPGVARCDNSVIFSQAVLKKMKEEGATWVTHNGDVKDESDKESIRSDQTAARTAALGFAAEMESALQATFPEKVVHVLGNHDMDRLTKGEMLGALSEPSSNYVRSLGGGVSAVVIDSTYDAEGRNYSTTDCQTPGNGCIGGHGDWKYAYVPDWQLEWLKTTLEAEKVAKRKVLLFSHFRLDGDRSENENSEWLKLRIVMNAQEVRAVLEEYKSTVLAVFHGHDHRAEDAPRVLNGIGYYTLVAMVEATEAEKAPWAMVRVWPEACRVQIVGHGEVPVSACDGAAWCKDRTLRPFTVDWKNEDLGDADCQGQSAKTELV